MTPKYRFLDEIDMVQYHGLRCELDVSTNWIGLTPLKGGGPPIIIAQAVKSRESKPKITISPNGQPAVVVAPDPDVSPVDVTMVTSGGSTHVVSNNHETEASA